MAENKEITTLHPYMNRNKNRYPNVKEENIPDTIQRKLTAGTGINISPENVISATGGDSYTRDETDALLDTKADKLALENVNKVVPTDIAVKDGKLGLEHDTTWLTNQNAITLGDGLSYDDTTKTLKAEGSGAKLPAGTKVDPFVIDNLNVYKNNYTLFLESEYFKTQFYTGHQEYTSNSHIEINVNSFDSANKIGSYKTITTAWNRYNQTFTLTASNISGMYDVLSIRRESPANKSKGIVTYYKRNEIYADYISIPTDKTESYYLNATYDDTSKTSAVAWTPVPKRVTHNVVVSGSKASEYDIELYLTIESYSNLALDSLTDLDTIMGKSIRMMSCTGYFQDVANNTTYQIFKMLWNGTSAGSFIYFINNDVIETRPCSWLTKVEEVQVVL